MSLQKPPQTERQCKATRYDALTNVRTLARAKVLRGGMRSRWIVASVSAALLACSSRAEPTPSVQVPTPPPADPDAWPKTAEVPSVPQATGCPEDGAREPNAPSPRESVAKIGWSLASRGDGATISVVLPSSEHVVVIGAYEGHLGLGELTLEGGGVFAAWLGRDGSVAGLQRLAWGGSGHDAVTAVAATLERGRLWVALEYGDVATIERGPAPLALHHRGADGKSTAVVAFDASGRRERVWALGGEGATAIAATADGVLVSTQGWGALRVTGDDGTIHELIPYREEVHPSLVELRPGAPPTAVAFGGDATAHATALPSASGTHVVVGRYGGFGPKRMTLGTGKDAPSLLAKSSDDDAAYDGFVATYRDGRFASAKRVLSYHSQQRYYEAVAAGDGAFVIFPSTGYDVVFDDGTPRERRLPSSDGGALARIDGTGKTCSIRSLETRTALFAGARGLVGIEEPPPNADVLPAWPPRMLVWFGVRGDVLARRTVPVAPALTGSVARLAPAPSWGDAWIGWTSRSTWEEGARLEIVRLDP